MNMALGLICLVVVFVNLGVGEAYGAGGFRFGPVAAEREGITDSDDAEAPPAPAFVGIHAHNVSSLMRAGDERDCAREGNTVWQCPFGYHCVIPGSKASRCCRVGYHGCGPNASNGCCKDSYTCCPEWCCPSTYPICHPLGCARHSG